MRILLDTNILLWAVGKSSRFDRATRDMLEEPDNAVLFSAASIWEIAIKTGLGRFDFKVVPNEVIDAARDMSFTELPITAKIAAQALGLPHHHKDPFDRMLIVQAMAEPAVFLTSDRVLTRYSELVTLVEGRLS